MISWIDLLADDAPSTLKYNKDGTLKTTLEVQAQLERLNREVPPDIFMTRYGPVRISLIERALRDAGWEIIDRPKHHS